MTRTRQGTSRPSQRQQRTTWRRVASIMIPAALCFAVFPSLSSAQGGWRQWEALVALPFPGEALPAVPTAALCKDVIVRRDGSTTIGHITLVRVRWSEGLVVQRSDTVDLRDVAYLVFAAPNASSANCQREAPRHEPNLTFPCVPYSVGNRQMETLCADDRWNVTP